MQLFVEDIAFGVLKTLITSDQRELLQIAKADGKTTTDAAAEVSFEFAESFLNEYNERYRSNKRKSR